MPLGKPLLDILDRMSCGGVVLDSSDQVLRLNRTAERILQELNPAGSNNELSRDQVRSAMKRLMSPSRHFRLRGNSWSGVERTGKRQLLMHSVQLDEASADGPDRVVILIDLDAPPMLNHAVLQKVFELTEAEARLACEIATGKSLADIADAREVSIATARSQLASIFAKTLTRRQAELVALLTRISILP